MEYGGGIPAYTVPLNDLNMRAGALVMLRKPVTPGTIATWDPLHALTISSVRNGAYEMTYILPPSMRTTVILPESTYWIIMPRPRVDEYPHIFITPENFQERMDVYRFKDITENRNRISVGRTVLIIHERFIIVKWLGNQNTPYHELHFIDRPCENRLVYVPLRTRPNFFAPGGFNVIYNYASSNNDMRDVYSILADNTEIAQGYMGPVLHKFMTTGRQTRFRETSSTYYSLARGFRCVNGNYSITETSDRASAGQSRIAAEFIPIPRPQPVATAPAPVAERTPIPPPQPVVVQVPVIKTTDVERACIACMENLRDHCYLPCGHMAYCGACVVDARKNAMKCALCRETAHEIKRIFL